jgi:DNA-directed RNA polymerase specialized sigma24 family protein
MRAIAELQKQAIRSHLVEYAGNRTNSEADAEDLLADAVECVCDPDCKPWDPAKASFTRHMRLVMDHVVIRRARGGYARFEQVDSPVVDATAVDRNPPADQALHDQRELARQRRLGNLLMDKLEGRDPVAVKVFRAACEGIEDPAEQAAAIGCEASEVYEALRRLKYHGASIAAEDERAEALRMKQAREGARKEAKQ